MAGKSPSSSHLHGATLQARTFTTEYYFTAQAVIPGSEWLASYTVQQVCTGDPANWTSSPVVPPDFATTVITCDACGVPTQTITCPVVLRLSADHQQDDFLRAWGNGVTVTTTAIAEAASRPGKRVQGEGDNGSGGSKWWPGTLLTQTGSPTGHYTLYSSSAYAEGDAATMGSNTVLCLSVVSLVIAVLSWQ